MKTTQRETTRRGILSTIGGMYDPLGLVGPVILQTRIILQQLAQLKLGWDDEIRGNWLCNGSSGSVPWTGFVTSKLHDV